MTKTRPMRTPAAAAAILILLAASACDRKPEQPAPAPAPASAPSAAAPTPPLSYRSLSADAEVSLNVPRAVAAVPALYGTLFSAGRNDLQAFEEGAKGEHEELRANGETVRPYGRSLDYAVSAETPRLISLVLNALEFTGGAHPNTTLSATVWDKQAGREVPTAALFRPDADMAGPDKALCDAVHAAKKAKVGDAALTGELKACPRLKSAALALAASTTPGKAGGVVALFSPYALGAYVEGAYRVVVPLSAIQGALAPAYAGEFAGAPAPDAASGPEQ